MSQSAYSWMGTRIHLVLEDDFANAYNRAQEGFFQAQRDFEAQHGTKWTGFERIGMPWTNEELNAWNGIADVINLLVKLNGGSLNIPESEVTSDFLIKL